MKPIKNRLNISSDQTKFLLRALVISKIEDIDVVILKNDTHSLE